MFMLLVRVVANGFLEDTQDVNGRSRFTPVAGRREFAPNAIVLMSSLDEGLLREREPLVVLGSLKRPFGSSSLLLEKRRNTFLLLSSLVMLVFGVDTCYQMRVLRRDQFLCRLVVRDLLDKKSLVGYARLCVRHTRRDVQSRKFMARVGLPSIFSR